MKRYLFFDSEKCSACGACALACMDQNDIDIPGRGAALPQYLYIGGKGRGSAFLLRKLYALCRCPLRHGLPQRLPDKGQGDRLYPVRYDYVYWLPFLRHGMSLRRSYLWTGWKNAQMRCLHRAPEGRAAACLCKNMPHRRPEPLDGGGVQCPSGCRTEEKGCSDEGLTERNEKGV